MKLNQPYFQNFWGRKFTNIAAILFIILLAWMIYRHYSLGVPFGGDPEKKEIIEQ